MTTRFHSLCPCRPAARVLVLLIAVCVLCPSSLLAQAPASGHASHHPSQAKGKGPASTEASKAGGMGGGGMGGGGGGMGKMMEKMGVPKPKELYPSLMELPDLPLEKRADVQADAHRRMKSGSVLLDQGLKDLSRGSSREDFAAMQKAAAKLKVGLAEFESGLAAHRALAEGKAPRNIALRWFKRDMNLLPPAGATPEARIWGMAPFHAGVMAILACFVAAMLWMYFFKMRRASALLENLSTVQAPPADVETQASQQTPPAAPDISQGLLAIASKKICRLRVCQIFQETADVKTFRLVACNRGPIPFSYLPGQFLTLTLPVSDKPIRRSYTISSSPTQGYHCEITVKREDQGAGSRYLHDVIKEGDTLDVKAASGKLIFTGKEADSVVLISGGVGITPMMSITRALTDMGWRGDIYFIVACRDPESFIFGKEIERIAQRHSNVHVFAAMSRIDKDAGAYHAGRLSKELLASWVPDIVSKPVYICGAPPMMDASKKMLAELGLPPSAVHTENFGSQQKLHVRSKLLQDAASGEGSSDTSKKSREVKFSKAGTATRLLSDETLLEAAERVEVDIDSSCRVGMCGECTVKLLSGTVEMETEEGLEPDDKAAGKILACQAKASSDVVVDA